MDREMLDNLQPAFDELETMGYCVSTDKEVLEPYGNLIPCRITARQCTYDDNSECWAVDITCLQEDAYVAPDHMRIMDIIKCVNDALDNTAEWNGRYLEFIEMCACDSDYNYCSYELLYGLTDEVKKPQKNCIDFYYNGFWKVMKAVFETDAVRDNLMVDGVPGSDLSLEQLIERGYVRATNQSGVDDEENNVVVFVELEDYTNIRLKLIVFALGVDEQELDEHRQAAVLAINSRMVCQIGFYKYTSDCNENELMTTLVYARGKSEEAVAETEVRKQINNHIFVTTEVLDKLRSYGIRELRVSRGFFVDIIDAPARILMTGNSYIDAIFRLYRRDSMINIKGKSDLTIMIDSKDNRPVISRNEGIDIDSINTIMSWYEAMFALGDFINKNHVLDNYMDLKQDGDGVLLYIEDGQIRHRLVSGADRPMLAVEKPDDGVTMARPYFDEVFMTDDSVKSLELLEAVAKNGDGRMKRMIAFAYAQGGDGIKENPYKSACWIEAAANIGDKDAMLQMSMYYAGGYGVDRDYETALEWARKATAAGLEQAKEYEKIYEYLIEGYSRVTDELPGNQDSSKIYYAIALWKLAERVSYFDAKPIYKEVVALAKAVQNDDDGSIAILLGDIYANGLTGEVDDGAAIKYYTEAYEKGQTAISCYIAQCYANGFGVAKNIAKAIEWYTVYLDEFPDDKEVLAALEALEDELNP